jgi:hypothetical protein
MSIEEEVRYGMILQDNLYDQFVNCKGKKLTFTSIGCGNAYEIFSIHVLSEQFGFYYDFIGLEINKMVNLLNLMYKTTKSNSESTSSSETNLANNNDKNSITFLIDATNLKNYSKKPDVIIYRHPLLFSHDSSLSHKKIIEEILPKIRKPFGSCIISFYERAELEEIQKISKINFHENDLEEVNKTCHLKLKNNSRCRFFSDDVKKEDHKTHKEKYVLASHFGPLAPI